MTLDATLRLGINRWQDTAEGHALIQRHIPTDDSGFANDDTRPVIDEKPAPDGGARVNLDASEQARELHDEPRRKFQFHAPQRIGDAIGQHHLETGVQEHRRQLATGGGVALEDRVQIAVQLGEHVPGSYPCRLAAGQLRPEQL